MPKWQQLSTEIIFKHPRITLAEDLVKLPDGTETKYLRFENTKDFVTIIPVAEDGRILMLQEHAYPINEMLLQFSEGEIDGEESAEEAARRELLEETGYTADKFKLIGKSMPGHRRSNMRGNIFVATGLKKVAEPDGDAEEQGSIIKFFSEEEIISKIVSGEVFQVNALAAWTIYASTKTTI